MVERMELAGCREIRVVTRPEKDDLRIYAETRGLEVVLGHPAHIGESIALGLAGMADDVVALGFPDSIWDPVDGFAVLRDALEPPAAIVLGLFDFFDARRADVVVLDDAGRVRDIEVKPTAPTSTLIWGCLVARLDALRGIERAEWPSDHVRRFIASGSVAARYLSDRYVDIGTPEGLAHARSPARSE
jgi:glucose-1-phosphate thymidylyltransferase